MTDAAQIIHELQQAVTNWQRRAWAAEASLSALLGQGDDWVPPPPSGEGLTSPPYADPLFEVGTLHPLADREKSAATFECEDCIGMAEHGCYCASAGASKAGGP